MPGSAKKGGVLFGAALGLGATVAVVAALGVFAGSGVAASAAVPHNASPPTITGVPQEGRRLTGHPGIWTGNPTDYNYFWARCDMSGTSCANISTAHGSTYQPGSADVGNRLRFRVQATNASGSTFASSVPTAVVTVATAPVPTTPPPPSSTGCPGGTGPVQVTDVTSPASLLIDQQQAEPSVVTRGTPQLIVRYHVTACGSRPVQGALVYATAVPFSQLSIPPEQATGSDGWAELDFRTLAGFPLSPKQGLIAIFVRARKSGENLLGGISARRLFSVPVNLRG
jgi:hypothetical protein